MNMRPIGAPAVDCQLSQLHTDIRSMLRAGIAAVVVLAGMIAGLYVRTDEKFARTDLQVTEIKLSQQRIEAKLDMLMARRPSK